MMKFDLINSVSYDDETDFDINLNDGSGDDDDICCSCISRYVC